MSCNCSNSNFKSNTSGVGQTRPIFRGVFNGSVEACDNKDTLCGECQQRQPFVQLEPTEGYPTTLTLYSSWGTSTIDLLTMIKAGETDTKLCFNEELKQLEYSSEHYLQGKRDQDVLELICLWRVMKIEDHGNADKNLETGDAYVYNSETKSWEAYPLVKKVNDLDARINALTEAVENLTQQVLNLANRVGDIENLIYNYPADKTTKIARGNMRLEYSIDNGGSYPMYIAGADDNGNNVVRARVQ